MTTIRRIITNERLFEDSSLSLKELVTKNKIDLAYADLKGINLKRTNLLGTNF